MIRRKLDVLLFLLLAETTVQPALAGEKREQPPPTPRYSMLSVKDTVVLLDKATGQTWALQRPPGAKAPVWVPIERKELASSSLPRDKPVGEVPRIQEIDIRKIHIDPQGRPEEGSPKGSKPRSSDYATYPSRIHYVQVPVGDLGKYCFGQDDPAKIVRQIDPDRQRLLLVWWYSWSGGTDKLTYGVRDGQVEFTFEHGRSLSQGRGSPSGPCVRLFALRNSVQWRAFQVGPPDDGEEKGKPQRQR